VQLYEAPVTTVASRPLSAIIN